jgi:hypothetical protein
VGSGIIGSMSVERLLAAAVFVCSALLLLQLGPAAVKSWRIYSGTGKRRQEDATGHAPLPSPAVVDRTAILGGLGFHQLGQTRLVLPVGERFAWIMAADDAESYAILVDNERTGGLVGIYSAWPDGMWLCTLHPLGQALDRPSIQVRIVPTTLADAIALHRAGLDRLEQVHGAPRSIRTMPDMLALDLDYRTRFGGSRLLPLTARIILRAVAVAAIAVLSLALLIAAR